MSLVNFFVPVTFAKVSRRVTLGFPTIANDGVGVLIDYAPPELAAARFVAASCIAAIMCI